MKTIDLQNYTLFVSNPSSSFSGVYFVNLKALLFRPIWEQLLTLKIVENGDFSQFINHGLKFSHLGILNFSLESLNEDKLYYQFKEAEKLTTLNKKYNFFSIITNKIADEKLMFDYLTPPTYFFDINLVKIFFDLNSIYKKDINFYQKQLEVSSEGYHYHKISYLFAFLVFSKVKLWNYLLFLSIFKIAEKTFKNNIFKLPIFISRSDIYHFFKSKQELLTRAKNLDSYLLLDEYVTTLLDYTFQEIELVNKSTSSNYWIETYWKIVKFKDNAIINWNKLEKKFQFNKALYYDNLFIQIFKEFRSI